MGPKWVMNLQLPGWLYFLIKKNWNQITLHSLRWPPTHCPPASGRIAWVSHHALHLGKFILDFHIQNSEKYVLGFLWVCLFVFLLLLLFFLMIHWCLGKLNSNLNAPTGRNSHVHCQHDCVWNHLGHTPLEASTRVFPEMFIGGGKICPECGQHHPLESQI